MNSIYSIMRPFNKYCAELSEAIRLIVLNRKSVSNANIRSVIPSTVASQDYVKFIALVLKEFNTLYEGNISRFRLAPSEFNLWQDTVNKGS